MIFICDKNTDIIVKPFNNRIIKYAFHDIDGTHSLIREWQPVMSICLYEVIQNGLPDNFDSQENAERLISLAGVKSLPETDAFCIESAGLSALTQMEWAIRKAIHNGKIIVDCNREINCQIIDRINHGEEHYDDLCETGAITEYLKEHTPRLFKLYEKVLNGYCRDKNLAAARKNPQQFQVEGSSDFLEFLYNNKVKNYFVTGAVVEKGMGMFEEVEALGYNVGKGKIIEDIIGSTWTEKKPKDEVMTELLHTLGINAENVLVVGDGRAEIRAGAELGAVVISRLPENAVYQRELHKKLGTNIIVKDYKGKDFYDLFKEVK